MRLPTPYFPNIPQFGNLSIDGIFLYYECPIVFTCIDCSQNLYICVCCDMENEQRWLIAPTSIERIENMLSQRITLKAMFKDAGGYGCVATWHQGQEKENYSVILCTEFSNDDLADEGKFFETEPAEFESYLQAIRNRKEYNDQLCIEATLEQGAVAGSEVTHSISVQYEKSDTLHTITPMFADGYKEYFFGNLISSEGMLLEHAFYDFIDHIVLDTIDSNKGLMEPELKSAA